MKEKGAGSSTEARRSSRFDQRGASLILAMIFLVVCAPLVVVLCSAAANDLRNVKVFASVQTLHSAESSAVNIALYDVRYTPNTCTMSAPVAFSPPGLSINVYCSTVSTPLLKSSRVVTLKACTSGATWPCTPDLTAIVTFDDYAAGFPPPRVNECSSGCGEGMTITDWRFR